MAPRRATPQHGGRRPSRPSSATALSGATRRPSTRRRSTNYPVEDLRIGWDLHVEFGLAQPAFYTLIFGDVRPGYEPPAAEAAAILNRIARAGRLRVPAERATQLVHATGKGVTLTLIATPPEKRDLTLSTLARESILAAITTGTGAEAASTGLVNAAVSLHAPSVRPPVLTEGERVLLGEWLHRIGEQWPGAGTAHRRTEP